MFYSYDVFVARPSRKLLKVVFLQIGLLIGRSESALLKSTTTSYYSDLNDQCAGDSTKLLKPATFLCKNANDSDLPPRDHPVLLANKSV